jgi:hypothetical protein
VCDVLQNIHKYQGKVIEVRGEWAVGYALIGDCSLSLKIGEQTWVNGIALDTPESVNQDINSLSDTSDRPTWNLDRKAWEIADDVGFRLVSANGPDTKLFATFVGRLDVVGKLLGKPETADNPERSGFGHLNSYPARLVMITVRDVGLKKRE